MTIELVGIHKRFGKVHANNAVSLRFERGRIIGILGENGAGKSTLMKILSGYQPPDEGQIIINGAPVHYNTPQAAIANGIGMLQQDPLDIPAFTVLENFIYGAPRHIFPNRTTAAKALAELATRFGFALDANAQIASLSIAQRQQLEIARLLALGVRTLILDEPTTGISAEQKEILFGALRRLTRDENAIVLLVSHKLEDVIALCDEIAVLRAGAVVGTRAMPATAKELVTLMFGQEIQPQTRTQMSMDSAAEVLRFEAVTLSAQRLTIEQLSLSLRAGEVIGLAGLDGSGQDLIMRAAAGLLYPLGGTIRVKGQVLNGQPYRTFAAHGVTFSAAGRVEEGLVAGLTLTEHMALVSERGLFIDWSRAEQTMQAQIAHYNIRGTPSLTIESLSGGNQQRVLMALLPEKPTVMVLENPTRGLDVDSSLWIWQQLLERRTFGTAILFSSPDLDELVAYSDRIIVCYAGQTAEIPDVRATTAEELGRYIGGHFEEIHA